MKTKTPYWIEIWRFRDTGKFYDSITLQFESDDYNTAIEQIKDHHRNPDMNQSEFDYVVTANGNIRHLHPKLITGKLSEHEPS